MKKQTVGNDYPSQQLPTLMMCVAGAYFWNIPTLALHSPHSIGCQKSVGKVQCGNLTCHWNPNYTHLTNTPLADVKNSRPHPSPPKPSGTNNHSPNPGPSPTGRSYAGRDRRRSAFAYTYT
ncbi:uncharacterized protein H6S33_011588 [Morchella sextelata]|uniref:uncharacterized protein n=1 Tax=Morchella sextelata TaxID=1174677 RepID=UPI001D03A876|nr:uncharacterized protein H6S33_011588 [Morchella sextelata]KAH0611161.1 hypothetical protein H6S33_011588 [Morchella sextelata]